MHLVDLLIINLVKALAHVEENIGEDEEEGEAPLVLSCAQVFH